MRAPKSEPNALSEEIDGHWTSSGPAHSEPADGNCIVNSSNRNTALDPRQWLRAISATVAIAVLATVWTETRTTGSVYVSTTAAIWRKAVSLAVHAANLESCADKPLGVLREPCHGLVA